MRVFFDTSVIVAASVADHPHHSRAWPALQRVAMGKDQGFVGAHSIAETYAALTRVPVVPADAAQYLEALATVQEKGLPGAKIYDALLLACAARSGAERGYTFNLGDFRELASVDMQARIAAP